MGVKGYATLWLGGIPGCVIWLERHSEPLLGCLRFKQTCREFDAEDGFQAKHGCLSL